MVTVPAPAQFQGDALADEIAAAVAAAVDVTYNPELHELTVTGTNDRATVERVVADHVPPDPPPDPDEQIAEAIRAVRDHADTRADVKGLCDALLGSGGGARVPGQRPDAG